jgi:cytochrome P450
MFDLLRFRHDPLGSLDRLSSRGDVVRVGNSRVTVVTHPDLVREVLVTQAANFIKGPALRSTKATLGEGLLTSEGEFHKRQRRIIGPAFHATHVAAYGQTMARFADRLSNDWHAGDTIDIHAQMTHLTLEIVAKTLFDAEVRQDVDAIGQAMTASVELFPLMLLPFGKYIARLPLPRTLWFKHTWPTLTATIERFIAERTASGAVGNDLLSVLIRATDPENGVGMTDQQLRDEAITLFTAGHETTANGSTYAFHLLAHHADVREQLQQELKDVFGDSTGNYRQPEATDASRLPFTRAVVSEAMRIYPPVWTVGREATADVTLSNGATLPAGTVVLASQWICHRDPRWWPRPGEFDPSRWLVDDESRPRYAYFPFAGGPRSCIGEAFAWLEMILVVATVLRKWDITPMSPRALRLAPSITLRPRDPVLLRVTQRN